MTDNKQITAAMLIIGNEVLSGRTQDKNLAFVGNALGEIGIDMKEVRIVPDQQDEIVDAVNALRVKYTYVFTSGGIGPTHDDITADCIARAFGVSLDMHPLATELLEAHYEAQGIEFNAARARMARIPDGASLIDNPVSTAPGFRIGNVYVMAGVPRIMKAMMENILLTLDGGEKLSSVTITAQVPEGSIAEAMEKLQGEHPEVSIGLYPFYGADGAGVSVVARGRDLEKLGEVEAAVKQQFTDMGMDLIERPAPAEFLKG